jgi:hypothetical protein
LADPQTTINHLALVVAATSAIKSFFNMNPLVKLDGYYSDQATIAPSKIKLPKLTLPKRARWVLGLAGLTAVLCLCRQAETMPFGDSLNAIGRGPACRQAGQSHCPENATELCENGWHVGSYSDSQLANAGRGIEKGQVV